MPKNGYFMSGRQMREAKWQESVANARLKRNGEDVYIISYQCGCGCGTFQISRNLVKIPVVKKDDGLTHRNMGKRMEKNNRQDEHHKKRYFIRNCSRQ